MEGVKEMTAKQAQERLNYFNGQRLEATDYRIEQAYHMAVRRELNRSLYTSGIAKGLEVTKKSAHTVLISPGLALDYWGREIILAEELELTVGGMISTTPGEVFGNYLVIEYGEERSSPMHEQCPSKSGENAGLNWSGPTRIIAKPLIYVQDSWPSETSGKLVLAQIELKQGCEVVKVYAGMRKYVAAGKPPKVRTISFEGEKDIDASNPKVLYFHVSGGYPEKVLLILRASKFSSLYYTELGLHNHESSAKAIVTDKTKDLRHHHVPVGPQRTGPGSKHKHSLYVDGDAFAAEADDKTGGEGWNERLISEEEGHTHEIGNLTFSSELDLWKHTHDVTITPVVKDAGATGAEKSRSGATLQYLDHLQIWFDKNLNGSVGVNITNDVLAFLNWGELGDGSKLHKLVTHGTDNKNPLDLIQFGLDLSPGEHSLTFMVNKGGGQIHYNLYVE